MRVYLDDVRTEPPGWVRAYTASEAITLLETGSVTEISLDHDLGDDPKVGDGYDVILWLERQVHYNADFVLPAEINVHSANPVASNRMKIGIVNLRRAYANRRL